MALPKRYAQRLASSQDFGLSTIRDPDSGAASVVMAVSDPRSKTYVTFTREEAHRMREFLDEFLVAT